MPLAPSLGTPWVRLVTSAVPVSTPNRVPPAAEGPLVRVGLCPHPCPSSPAATAARVLVPLSRVSKRWARLLQPCSCCPEPRGLLLLAVGSVAPAVGVPGLGLLPRVPGALGSPSNCNPYLAIPGSHKGTGFRSQTDSRAGQGHRCPGVNHQMLPRLGLTVPRGLEIGMSGWGLCPQAGCPALWHRVAGQHAPLH